MQLTNNGIASTALVGNNLLCKASMTKGIHRRKALFKPVFWLSHITMLAPAMVYTGYFFNFPR